MPGCRGVNPGRDGGIDAPLRTGCIMPARSTSGTRGDGTGDRPTANRGGGLPAVRDGRSPHTTAARIVKKTLLDRAVRPALRLLSRFSQRRCEACGARVAVMLPYGRPRRWGAQCPECQALERHRFHARLLRERCPPSGDALVVAPDPATLRVVEGIDGLDVTTTDLNRDDVTVRADITALPFPDGSFRLVVCSHVLEHVPDDAAALGQLARVLHSDGVALIAVPMRPGDTIEEDLAPLSAQERERRFG